MSRATAARLINGVVKPQHIATAKNPVTHRHIGGEVFGGCSADLASIGWAVVIVEDGHRR